jgi:hypothetical protein
MADELINMLPDVAYELAGYTIVVRDLHCCINGKVDRLMAYGLVLVQVIVNSGPPVLDVRQPLQ